MCNKVGDFCIPIWNLVGQINWGEIEQEDIPVIIEDIIKVHMKCVGR